MNRRNFLSALAKGFAILPAAMAYNRVWKFATPESQLLSPQNDIIDLEWENAESQIMWSFNDHCLNKIGSWRQTYPPIGQPGLRFSTELRSP